MTKTISHFKIQFTDGSFKEFINPKVIKKDNKILLQDRKFPDYYVEFVPEVDYDNNNK